MEHIASFSLNPLPSYTSVHNLSPLDIIAWLPLVAREALVAIGYHLSI